MCREYIFNIISVTGVQYKNQHNDSLEVVSISALSSQCLVSVGKGDVIPYRNWSKNFLFGKLGQIEKLENGKECPCAACL